MSNENSHDAPTGDRTGEAGDYSSDPELSGTGPLVLRDADPPPATPEPPGPSHADWRQLADEVRRLSAQIAHGRA